MSRLNDGCAVNFSKSSVNLYYYWFVELVKFALRGGANDISIVRQGSYNWIYSTDHKLFVYLLIQ